jgi:hypothetical protein
MTSTTPTPAEPLQVRAQDDPDAAALYGIVHSLRAIAAGHPGASHNDLISQGLALAEKFPRPANRVQWAQQTVALADFWGAASRFRPGMAANERDARAALTAARVTLDKPKSACA